MPQLILFCFVLSTVRVALWKLATTHDFANNDEVRVTLGIFGARFCFVQPSSAPVMLIGILYCPPGMAFYTGTVKHIIRRFLQIVLRLTLFTIQGIILWKLFTSSKVVESAKIGLAVSIVSFIPGLAGMCLAKEDNTGWLSRDWFITDAFSYAGDLNVMALFSMLSPGLWKLSTCQLSDGAKIAIGIGSI